MEDYTKPETNNQEESRPYPHYDCYKLTKVYDWRKLLSVQNFNFSIPPTDLPAIEDAIAAGHMLDIVVDVHSVSTSVRLIERKYDDPDFGCIILQKVITIHVQIFDEFDHTLLSVFDRTVQLFDSTKACIPEPLNESNVIVKVVASEALPLSTMPADGIIIIELSTCQEIEVLLDVKAKLETKGYCKSKQGETCQGSAPCEYGNECSGYYPDTCYGTPGSCYPRP